MASTTLRCRHSLRRTDFRYLPYSPLTRSFTEPKRIRRQETSDNVLVVHDRPYVLGRVSTAFPFEALGIKI